MHSLTPEYLAALRFDGSQAATLRTLGEYQGKQQLYAAQSPEALKGLRQIAVVESTESSNRLEGVVVAPSRLKSLVIRNAIPKSRSEQGIAGYRDALALIHESAAHMPFSDGVVLQRTPCCIATCRRRAGAGRLPITTSSSVARMALPVCASSQWLRT